MSFFTRIFLGFCLLFRNTKTPLNGCSSLFQQRGFTREYIFPTKKLLFGVFKCENTTLKTNTRGVLISWREYLFTSKQLQESSYCPVNNRWEVPFSGEYLLTVTPVILILCLRPYCSSQLWLVLRDVTLLSRSLNFFLNAGF